MKGAKIPIIQPVDILCQEVDASSVRKLETAFLVMVANWIGMEILLTPRTSQFLKYYALNQSKT